MKLRHRKHRRPVRGRNPGWQPVSWCTFIERQRKKLGAPRPVEMEIGKLEVFRIIISPTPRFNITLKDPA